MNRMQAKQKALDIAVTIKNQFVENECINPVLYKTLQKLAYDYEIAIYYDQNNIPEQVEDDTI